MRKVRYRCERCAQRWFIYTSEAIVPLPCRFCHSRDVRMRVAS